jgi:hypothetical protein
MKIADLQTVLTKVQQITGEAEVILKDVETGAETVLQNIGLELGADGSVSSSVVTINHGPAAPDPEPAPATETPDTDTAATAG